MAASFLARHTPFRLLAFRRSSSSSCSASSIFDHSTSSRHSSSSPHEKPRETHVRTPEDAIVPLHADTFLVNALKEQLTSTLDCIEHRKIEIKDSFDPFEIVSNEGSSALTLSRRTNDEEITVRCILEIEEPDDVEYLLEDNEDELKLIQRLSMNIQLRKSLREDETRFLIVCHYVNNSFIIEGVMCVNKSTYIQSDHPYSGPPFSKLSERLQNAFYEIIKDRGIEARLADLAIEHLTSTYQRESISWLRNVRKFLKKKG